MEKAMYILARIAVRVWHKYGATVLHTTKIIAPQLGFFVWGGGRMPIIDHTHFVGTLYKSLGLNEHALFINEIFAGAKSPYKKGVARPV